MQQGDDVTVVTGNNAPVLETVFEDNEFQLTGVAVSRDGRVFTNYPRWEGPHLHSVVEVIGVNKVQPFPNEYMNSWKDGEDGRDKWVCVQAVYIDDTDTLWVVDPACPQMKEVYRNSHKLVRINLETNAVERVYFFDAIAGKRSYINDVRVDTRRQVAYLTNSNEGGIVVINLQTGTTRQLLQEDASVRSDPAFSFEIEGRVLEKEGKPVVIHSDGIALTPDGDWLYYKPLTDNKLYRIRTKVLLDESLVPVELTEWVEDLGAFTTSDGLIFDLQGNLYLGDLQASAIMRVDKDHKMTTLLQDERLVWPDSYAVSPNGYLYLSCSQIHKQPEYNSGKNRRTGPYAIYRVKLP